MSMPVGSAKEESSNSKDFNDFTQGFLCGKTGRMKSVELSKSRSLELFGSTRVKVLQMDNDGSLFGRLDNGRNRANFP